MKPPMESRGAHCALVDEFPQLAQHTSGAALTNVYLETYPSLHEARPWVRYAGWNDRAQAVLDAHWPTALDGYVADLISTYGGQWAHAFEFLAPVQQPDYVAALGELAATGELALDNMYRGDVAVTTSIALSVGSLRYGMGRFDWPFPMPMECGVCGQPSFYDFVRYWLIRRYGRPGICAPCLAAAAAGHDMVGDVDAAVTALTALARHAAVVPPKSFRDDVTTVGIADERRRRIIAALLCVPSAAALQGAVGAGSWLEVLQRAGIVGDSWRPSRGTICLAADGHTCRSLGERSIDDWFHAHGIAHQLEPAYPSHPKLNPNGRLRADWKVAETYVEYAGMLEQRSYAAKMAVKVELAAACGIALRVVAPEDLYRLDETLAGLT